MNLRCQSRWFKNRRSQRRIQGFAGQATFVWFALASSPVDFRGRRLPGPRRGLVLWGRTIM